MKSPKQQIFDAVFAASLNLGFDTYDYLPADGTSYPFVYVGEQINVDKRTKRFLYGEVEQTVHVYAIQRNGEQPHGTNRVDFTGMIDRLQTEMRKIKRTDNFVIKNLGMTDTTMIDTSGSPTLLHGVIEARYQFH
ncbi:hypothetical protein J18TS1_12580 [Oceanobacillus oncorhynchi subsp. incaldanensis]|uniref:hypothetical protein n=1 Tax=Oceanobacillus oncorhynchi TaxID=545501 RepID=UPI001B2C264E|nr:hypothetical protein [Oceanobacillus oncorhynchi]GIO18158.1 hypothetical protein J18TS1_12580 [Oceanobacillus oncorhynchi subsp. incaldanensis]